jgi:hypothetical protein
MVRTNDVIVPGKVIGIIKLEGMMKFVIHTAIANNGFGGLSMMLQTFFMHFVLGDVNHIDSYDVFDSGMLLISQLQEKQKDRLYGLATKKNVGEVLQ